MLRECPIDHRCMKRIAPERVYEAVVTLLQSAKYKVQSAKGEVQSAN
jgi:hypothetical protein